MKNTFNALLGASLLVMPSVAAAQAPPAADARVRISSRVVIEQARERTRVVEQKRDNRAEQTERVSHTFRIGGSGELQVSNLSGDITITRGGGSEVRVEAIKTARARTADLARETLAAMRVEFGERAGRAEVRVVYPREFFSGNQRNVGGSVTYNITAPEGTRITLKSMSGSIRVTGIKGELSATSMSGNVGIFDGSRVASASSMSGNVEVGDLRSETPVELSSTSGNVIVRHSHIARLELKSISGNVILDNVQVERVDARSVSGDLQFTSPLARGGRYNLNSLSGNVRVAVMSGSGFELNASSSSGTVQSVFELKDRTAGGSSTSRGGRTRTLRGIYGDGAALLDVTTFSGNVTITKK